LTIGTDETALDMTAIGGRRHDERAIVENPPAFG
jgi:hypothetical protein